VGFPGTARSSRWRQDRSSSNSSSQQQQPQQQPIQQQNLAGNTVQPQSQAISVCQAAVGSALPNQGQQNAEDALATSAENTPVDEGVLLARIHVPELYVSKCLQFPKDQLVWDVKQQCLASLPKV